MAADNRDALKIEALPETPINNIVIDHCSFGWSVDELASVWEGWNNVSLLNNIFAEPLHDSIHSISSILVLLMMPSADTWMVGMHLAL